MTPDDLPVPSIPECQENLPNGEAITPTTRSSVEEPSSAALASHLPSMVFSHPSMAKKIKEEVIEDTDEDSVNHGAGEEVATHPLEFLTFKGECEGETITGIPLEDEPKSQEILVGKVKTEPVETHNPEEKPTDFSGDFEDHASSSAKEEDVEASSKAGSLSAPLKVSTIKLPASGQRGKIQTLVVSHSATGAPVLHYGQDKDGKLFIPVPVAAASLQSCETPSNSAKLPPLRKEEVLQGKELKLVEAKRKRDQMTERNKLRREQETEEQKLKRERRLRQNRESFNRSYRHQAEYMRSLEDTVARLEDQNRALTDELNFFKELYCPQED